MFDRPSIIGRPLRRSNWKLIKASQYFVLQQNTSTQQNSNNKRRRHYKEYRIITKGFPRYRVSDHDDLNQIQDVYDILHDEVLLEVEGKKTSKKILKQLKSWRARNENSLPFDEDGDGYATDTSITPENSSNEMEDQDNDNYPLISPEITISSNSSTKSENAAIISPSANSSNKENSDMIGENNDVTHSPEQLDFDDSEDMQSSDGSDNEGVTGNTHNEWISLGASVLDSLMGWLEGPPLESVPTASSSSKQVNANASSNNKNQTILDIPMQFIDLLTYPEIDPKASKKASFAVLREISFVRQRRKMLLLLTIYMFLIRLCSFDLFLVLVFVSNCAMLFLMKNSGKVNVTMAKRAVRQRIGWAKQWAGSLFSKNRTNGNIVPNNSGHSNSRKSNNNSRTANISSNAYVNGSTNSVNGIPIQTVNMAKSTSQDILQSGSMSDTTHGGSVSTKVIAPKRGVFFRKSGTTSQTSIKEDKVISSITETSSLTGSSPSDFPLNSVSSTGASSPIQSSNPQMPSPILVGGIVSESSQPASSASIIQQSSQNPTTKRRFFSKRGNGNNNNNNNSSNNSNSQASNNSNFTLPNIVPTSPLQNNTLQEILDSDSSSTYKTSQTLIMTSVQVAIGGNSTTTNGNEGASNEELTAHSSKSPNNRQSSSSNSLSTTNNDLLVNDTYCEGERLKSLLGDLKVK